MKHNPKFVKLALAAAALAAVIEALGAGTKW
jgi:hypothetical protein